MPSSQRSPSDIYPSLTYDNAQAAIAWLCRAFGFTCRFVVPGPDGRVEHSELTLGTGVVMVGSTKAEDRRASPRSLAGLSQALSVYVADPDTHHELAIAAGARLVRPLRDEEYGARGYMVLDPEGHLWYFGNYRPGAYWQEPDGVAEPARPVAVVAAQVPARTTPSNYPAPFASRMAGRVKQPLGDLFGLRNFGVNLTRLAPGAVSSLRHAHTLQDEFVYILQGRPTLHTDEGPTALAPGMCAGFKAGTGNGHRLINETADEVVYLEVGDRSPGDEGRYPDDDLQAVMAGGRWRFNHKDGTPYT